MQRIDTIVVPTDFSTHSEHALRYAASIGEIFGATLHLLHVVTLHGLQAETAGERFPDISPLLKKAEESARQQLDANADRGRRVDVVKALTREVSAHEAIVDYAKRKSADLIVIATRGNTGVKHVLLGSVTERVVRYAPCPVLAVKEGDRDFVDPATGEVTIRRVLLADNLTEGPEMALRRAIPFLEPYHPEVHMVHAVETEVPAIYSLAGVESVFQLNPDLKDNLGTLLSERASKLVPPQWKVVSKLEEGKPHRVVANYADESEADLVIVSSERNIELEERIMGGTSERIVRHAPCPVLVI